MLSSYLIECGKRYSVETITDLDYAHDITSLVNIPTQDKSLFHSLEQAAGGIGLHVNANKVEYICFNREGAISTLNGGPLKLENKFMYLRSSVSFTEIDINMRLDYIR